MKITFTAAGRIRSVFSAPPFHDKKKISAHTKSAANAAKSAEKLTSAGANIATAILTTQADEDIPITLGSFKRLLVAEPNITPETPSPAPESSAAITRGARTLKTAAAENAPQNLENGDLDAPRARRQRKEAKRR
jgi:hypothetical protein